MIQFLVFLKFLFFIKAIAICIFCELVSFSEIKASEKILNEERFNIDSLISYSRISHTDNFILVDKNGKVYKSCLVRNPDGCPNPFVFYGYINHGISEEVVKQKKDGSYWCKTSIISSHLRKNHNWNEHNHRYRFWCDKNGWVKSKSP